MKTEIGKEFIHDTIHGFPKFERRIRIDQIDHPASAQLCSDVGECVASNSGLHTVLQGDRHCCKCGAR
jgi:hypothetical protein